MKTLVWLTAAAAVVGVPRQAAADEDYGGRDYVNDGGTTVFEPGLVDHQGDIVKPLNLQDPGTTLQVGGGMSTFTDSGLRGRTGLGGYWDVRSTLGLKAYMALELAYTGSAHSLTGDGIGDAAFLIGHGGEGVLRLNAPMVRGNTAIVPYIFGGMGFTYYSVQSNDYDRSVFRKDDTLLAYPVGAGFSFAYDHLTFDARATYRFTDTQRLLVGEGEDGTDFDSWRIGAQLGYLF